MKSQEKKLEARLREHRGVKDRTPMLEARIQAHRTERPSQKQREHQLNETHLQGRNEVYWSFAENNKKASCKYDDLGLTELLVEKRTQPAVVLATGVVSLDYALGGIPSGVIEIYGAESVGKTSLLIDIIRTAQGLGMETGLCPTEYFDTPYFEQQGVDLDSLLIFRGEYGEDVLEIAGDFITDSDNRVLFMDSATGLRPEKDEFANWTLMMLSWLENVVSRMGLKSCIVMTNQVRVRRSVDPNRFFAGGTDSTARRIAGIFDQRLELSRDEVSEDHFTLTVNIVANTLRPPARFVQLPFIKGRGIDVWRDLVRAAVVVGVLEKRGSWYYCDGKGIAQGEEVTAKLLSTHDLIGQFVTKNTLLRLERSEGTQ